MHIYIYILELCFGTCCHDGSWYNQNQSGNDQDNIPGLLTTFHGVLSVYLLISGRLTSSLVQRQAWCRDWV